MPKKEKVEYRRCLVSFFDLLGFKEIVRSRSAHDIASLVGLFQRTGRVSEETEEAFEAQSFQFSDSIVRMMPLDSHSNIEFPVGILFHEVLAIVHACLEMANHGVAIRGALTLGDAYYSGSRMFGPGMVRAYELETRVALYPRVIVDPAVMWAFKRDPRLKKDTHSAAEEAEYLRKLLRRDRDGIWFVDYLFAAQNEVDDPSQYLALLGNNKVCIEALLQTRTSLDDIASKGLWSAAYQNEVLDRLIEAGGEKKFWRPYRIDIPQRLQGNFPSRARTQRQSIASSSRLRQK